MRQLKNLLGAALLLIFAPPTFTSCGNIDNPLEEIQGSSSSKPKSSGSISYAITELLKGSKDPSFTNALTLTGDGTVSYSSSNPSVATVDANGKVTPVAVGTTTITATISDSESYTYATKQASYTIELQEGYSYREWDTVDKKYVTSFAPSDNCELITSSTTTLDGSKRYVVIGDVNVAHDIEITASSTIILCDNAELNINGRLHGNQLYIHAQSEGEEMGKLNVTTDTGTDGRGVIDLSTESHFHGGKITAIATGNTYRLYGIRGGGGINIYGGDIKAQGNESSGYGSHGIYNNSGVIAILGGRVEATGGNSTSNTSRAGDGICGKMTIDGDAIVIATGGNGENNGGGYGLNTNSFSSKAQGRAQITAKGGNSVNGAGGIGIHLQGGLEVSDNVQITATGGDNIGTDGKGGPGSENGSLTIKDQVSITISGGKSTGNKDGQHAIWNDLYYYGGTIIAIGGVKGPDGTSDGRAIESYRSIYNKTDESITFEYSNDGDTWGGTFDINGNSSFSPTYHGIRKTN